MIKSKCVLIIGGAVSDVYVEDLACAICSAGASYLSVQGTLVSARSTSAEDFLRRVQNRDFSFIFEEEERSYEIPSRLKQSLNDFNLDYQWSWEGHYRTDPGMILRDATRREEAQFYAIGGRIVLEVPDLADPSRIAAAQRWSAWKPKPFIVYDSNHERLRAQAAYL
jgi:hypothetical protein